MTSALAPGPSARDVFIANVSEFATSGINLELIGLGDTTPALKLKPRPPQPLSDGQCWEIVSTSGSPLPTLAILQVDQQQLRLKIKANANQAGLMELPKHVVQIIGGGKRKLVPLRIPEKTQPLLVQFRTEGSRATLPANLAAFQRSLQLTVTGLHDAPSQAGIAMQSTGLGTPQFIVLQPTTEHVPGIRLRTTLLVEQGQCYVQVTPEFVRHPAPATAPAKLHSSSVNSAATNRPTTNITPGPGSAMTLFDFAASDVLNAKSININDMIREKQQLHEARGRTNADIDTRRGFVKELQTQAANNAKSPLVGDQGWVTFQQEVAAKVRANLDTQQRELQSVQQKLSGLEQQLSEVENLEQFIADMHQRLKITFRVSSLTAGMPIEVFVAE